MTASSTMRTATLLLAAFATSATLTACGQKDNVTPHSAPAPQGQAPAPKPLAGEPQTSPAGGTPVFSGNAPVSPGGAVDPGEGRTPPDTANSQR